MSMVPFRVKALYDYSSEYDDDLNFTADTVITVTNIEDDEWYSGQYTDPNTGEQKEGIFPQNFAEIINEPLIPVSRPRSKQEKTVANADSVLVKEPNGGGDSQEDDILIKDDIGALEQQSTEVSEQEVKDGIKETTNKDESIEDNTIENEAHKEEKRDEKDEETAIAKSSTLPAANKPKKINALFNKIAAFNTQDNTPVLPSYKPKEESHVKQSFYGAGSSSYVPSGFGKKPAPSVSAPAPAERTENTDKQEEEEGEPQPKLSLKERIALLQKRQQEESEREAALLKRKIEKKKKKTPPNVPVDNNQVPSVPELSVEPKENPTGDFDSKSSADHIDPKTFTKDVDLKTSTEHVEPAKHGDVGSGVEESGYIPEDHETEADSIGHDEGNKEEVGQQVEDEKEDEDEDEEEEEEDEEEARKRALRERMAKLSGGAGMFGMMGVNPFAPNGSSTKKKPAPPKEEEVEAPKAIPILPMTGNVVTGDLPTGKLPTGEVNDKVTPSNIHESSSEVSSNVSEIKDDLDAATFASEKDDEEHVAKYVPAVTDEDRLENSVSEENEEKVEEPNISNAVSPAPVSATSTMYDIEEQKRVNLQKQKVVSDGENTGYEGDDDTESPIQGGGGGEEPLSGVNVGLSSANDISSSLQNLRTGKELQQDENQVAAPSLFPPPIPSGTAPPLPSKAPPTSSQTFPPVPSSAAPPIPENVSRSHTMPEGGSRDAAHDSLLYRRQSVDNHKRQSVDSIKHAVDRRQSIDSNYFQSADKLHSIDSNYSRASVDSYRSLKQANVDATSIDVYESNDWWLKGELPPSLYLLNNKSLIYEMEESRNKKRGGLVFITRDFYILFASSGKYKQKLISVTYQEQNVDNVTFQVFDYPVDSFNSQSENSGIELYKLASKYNGHTIPEPSFVGKLFDKLPDLLPPIGLAGFGELIYYNESQRSVHQTDDFQPGDILRIANAKFSGHNKLHQKIVYQVGSKEPLVTVISEFDSSKHKFRVLEKDSKNKVKPVSYKISDLISGSIKVFRPVSRKAYGW